MHFLAQEYFIYSMSAGSSNSSTGDNTGTKSRSFRFLNEPKNFSGDGDANKAVNWLNKMEKLKTTTKLSEDEILFIVGDHMVGKAEVWWNVIGSKAANWETFKEAFKKHYLSDQEDKWWQQLHSIKQGVDYETIDDLSLKMQELFFMLSNSSQSFQVRIFLNAINPKIAFVFFNLLCKHVP